jgi:hypothetical protein
MGMLQGGLKKFHATPHKRQSTIAQYYRAAVNTVTTNPSTILNSIIVNPDGSKLFRKLNYFVFLDPECSMDISTNQVIKAVWTSQTSQWNSLKYRIQSRYNG